MTDEREYVLGTHEAELVRLGLQHRLWSAQAFAIWERAGFGPGHTLFDVGCGPGYATFDLASLVGPQGRVIAFDESTRFVEHIRQRQRAYGVAHIDVRQGDVQQLDLEANSVDGAYCRWVLCYVPQPQRVIEQVAKALRPGACFAIQDYVNYGALLLAPPSAAMERVATAVLESVHRRGGDLSVAARLPAMMVDCGLELREVRPQVRVARPDSPLWQWPATFFRNYVPTLVEMQLLSTEEAEAFRMDWTERTRNPGAFFLTPPMCDIIAAKPRA
ncbi:MAG: methyltransferase domain-containing protein [Planctomycetes bacterium]|nr:methyltransferase domain-containing protein [Planctomycetota bacterium]